jgi:hypothetical protein
MHMALGVFQIITITYFNYLMGWAHLMNICMDPCGLAAHTTEEEEEGFPSLYLSFKLSYLSLELS